MSNGVFDHVQLSSIKLAAESVAQILNAASDSDKLIVTRAVFEIAAEAGVFDPNRLVELAKEQLKPSLGWKFSKSASIMEDQHHN